MHATMRRKPGILFPIELSLLEAAIDLRLRGTAEFYGFMIATEVSEREGARLLTAYGTLYKALSRMEKAGLVESRWEGPARCRVRRPATATPLLRDRRWSGSAGEVRGEGARSKGVAREQASSIVSAAFVESIIRLWTGLYTKGLPPELGAERRAEVESDLWEDGSLWRERGLSSLTMQRLGRWLLGIPADLSWRLEQIGSRKERPQETQHKLERTIKMPTTVAQRGMLGSVVLLAGFFIVMGPVSFLFAGSEDWQPTTFERAFFGIVPIVAGSMILTGLYVIPISSPWRRSPIGRGAIVMALLRVWLFFISIPVVIFMIWYGVSRARKVGRDRLPPGAGA